jgi:hypothetical protein
VRTIVNRRGIVVGLALLATVGMTACSANRTPSGAGPTTAQTSVPAANAAASQSAAAPSPTPTGIQNLVISSAGKSDLTTAFVAFKGISLSDIAGGGPTAGSVYYAYDPSTDTYWALADFATSSTASMQVQVNFQDGGSIGMFRRAGAAGAWHVQLGGIPEWCSESTFFPLPVLAAWSIPTTKPAGLGC